MKLLAPVTGFIFATPTPCPREELRRYMFWYKMNNRESERHMLGSFIGNPIYDSKFAQKLDWLRGMLKYKRIPWEESSYIIHEEELRAARRLDAQQRFQRKMSKITNAYNTAKENIKNSSELFKDDLYAALELDYKKHKDKAIASYNPESEISMPYSEKP